MNAPAVLRRLLFVVGVFLLPGFGEVRSDEMTWEATDQRAQRASYRTLQPLDRDTASLTLRGGEAVDSAAAARRVRFPSFGVSRLDPLQKSGPVDRPSLETLPPVRRGTVAPSLTAGPAGEAAITLGWSGPEVEINMGGGGGEPIVRAVAPEVAIPEPGTIVLLGSGLIGLAWVRRRRRA